jgi:hypothetical protein
MQEYTKRQARLNSEGTSKSAGSPENLLAKSAGSPLDSATLKLMESTFSHDFSHVRIHTDSSAAESAKALNALAYTVNRNIFFGEGQYRPGEFRGKRLLAHELAHSVQQSGGFHGNLTVSQPGDPSEQEASRAESAFAQGRPFSVSGRTEAGIMRQLEEPPATGAKNPPKKTKTYILPEVLPNRAKTTSRDVTFVEVGSTDEAVRRAKALNRPAEDLFLENLRRKQPLIQDGGAKTAAIGVPQDFDTRAQDELKNRFGSFWGTVFWWTRGGGQTGTGSPLWDLLEALSGFNSSVPIPRPGGEPVYRDTRGISTRTESVR